MKDNQQPITGLGEGDIGTVVFLCGDPARVDKIASGWKDLRVVCDVREYRVATGTRDGVTLTAASTGIGGPSTAIMVEELAKIGAKVLIRIGNSGAVADEVKLGDYVISTAAIRDDGTSKSYVRPDFPAVADYRVVSALVDAAAKQDTKHHTGITWSVDAFYARNKALGGDGGLASMSFAGYEQAGMNEQLTDAKRAGVKNIEMESSTIFTLASLFGLQAGCICTVSDRAPWPGPGQDMIELGRNIDGAIAVAVDAGLALAKDETSPKGGSSASTPGAVLGGVASAGSAVGSTVSSTAGSTAAGAIGAIGAAGAVVGAGIGAASGAVSDAKKADAAVINVDLPTLDIETPSVDVETPSLDIKTPTVGFDTPTVGIGVGSEELDGAAKTTPSTVPDSSSPPEPILPTIIKEATPAPSGDVSKIPSIFGSDPAPTVSVPDISRPEPIDIKPVEVPKPIVIDPIEPPKPIDPIEPIEPLAPIEPALGASTDAGGLSGGSLAAAGAAGAAAIGIGITGAKNAIGDAADSAAGAIGGLGDTLTDGSVKTANTLTWDPVVAMYQGRVVVDFYTPTCGPCRQMAPLFEEMARDNKDIRFVKVDASESYDLAAKFAIQSVPTFIVFERGHKIAQTTGANADKAAFMRWVKS